MSDAATAPLEIVERDLASFFRVPFEVYGDRYPFVPMLRGDLARTLDPAKNPLYRALDGTYYTALRGGRPVGRIAAHVHHAANQRFGERAGSFGFFDLEDDRATAAALLERAEAFARGHECTLVRGAMNLTANQEIGVLTEGDDRRPFLAQIYNPAYVAGLLEACGYRPTHPMRTLVKRDIAKVEPERILEDRHRALMVDPAYRFRPVERRRFAADVEAVRQVLNDAMDGNYLFVPMTEEEAQFQFQALKLVMDPALCRIAEHEGQPIGVCLAVPDVAPLLQAMRGRLLPFGWLRFLLGRRRVRDLAVIIILVKKAYHARGVIRVLTHDLYQAAKAGGYTSAGGTWIGDDNLPSLKAAFAFGLEPYHRTYMFEKAL